MSDIKIIGLTGNSGSGKSTVANILKNEGGYIIDADKIAHENMKQKGCAYSDIISYFGNIILDSDKNIDRKKLGNIVFNNKNKLNKLNEITHKYIIEKIEKEIKKIADNKEYKFIVIDAPLLIETGLNKKVDSVWVVYADFEKRVKRVMIRDNITEEEVKIRFKNQLNFEEQKLYADKIILNNDFNDIIEIVKGMINKFLKE